jgi:hypothetical protein
MSKVLLCAVLAVSTCFAQWLNYPSAGIPRTPDGKPDLSAPAPKATDGRPDLSGIWTSGTGKYLGNLAADGIEV